MKLSGSIEHIVYRSEETGYTVAVVDVEGKPTTCVGSFPMLSEGEWLEAEGEFTESKYGTQFKVSRFRLKPGGFRPGLRDLQGTGAQLLKVLKQSKFHPALAQNDRKRNCLTCLCGQSKDLSGIHFPSHAAVGKQPLGGAKFRQPDKPPGDPSV